MEAGLSGLFAMGIGLFVITAAVCDWNWFLMHRKAWLIRTLFGRNGARIFYGLLGSIFLLAGLALLVGMIR